MEGEIDGRLGGAAIDGLRVSTTVDAAVDGLQVGTTVGVAVDGLEVGTTVGLSHMGVDPTLSEYKLEDLKQ